MKLIPAFVPICALLLPGALAAETFQGKVSMSIATGSKDGSQNIDFSIKEGLTRMDIATPKGTSSIIMDGKNQQMTILIPQQRMYMVRPIPQPGAAQGPSRAPQAPQSTLRDTGVKENILGYQCTKYVATSAEGSSEIWVTDQLGAFTGLYQGGGPGRRPQAPQAWEGAIKGRNFFPMRVVSNTPKGTFKLEVTSVQRTSLPDSAFTPPEGWTKFDMGAMMGGAMPGGFPGARPSPGSN